MTERCTVTERGPDDNPYEHRCIREATHRIVDEDKEGFVCAKHVRILRHMFEPGSLRKLTPAERWPPTSRSDEPSEDMKVANRMAEYTPRRHG